MSVRTENQSPDLSGQVVQAVVHLSEARSPVLVTLAVLVDARFTSPMSVFIPAGLFTTHTNFDPPEKLPYTIGWQDLKDLFRQAAQGGAVIRADVHMGPDGRPKGSGIVVFENPSDAQNAIQQFNGFEWHGRNLEVREDRFAASGSIPYVGGGRGYVGGRGAYAGSFGRGGFAGGRGGGFGFGGGRGYGPGPTAFDQAPSSSVAPNPFTDFATAGTERSETIFVRNLPWSTSNEDLVELFTTIGKVEQAEIQYEPSGRSKGTGVVRFDAVETAETAINKFQGYQYGGRPLSLSFVKYLTPGGGEAMITDSHVGLTQDQIM
jgi:hypothetical protein